MKKITNILLLFLAVFAFSSCSEEIEGTDDLNYVSLEWNVPKVTVEQGGSTSVAIKVFSTQILGSDRTFSIEVAEGATTVNSENYTIPESVTIPANSNEGEFTISVSDNSLGLEPETLSLKIGNTEGVYIGSPLMLTIEKFCPFNIDDFVGTYTYTSEMFEDSWTVDVQKVDNHTLVVKDMVEDGKDVQIVLDEASLTASVAKQPVWTHSSYGVASFEGAGSFSPCTYRIELDLELAVSAGSFGTGHEVLQKN